MVPTELSPSKPCRRRILAISVRALMLLILGIAAGIGWWVHRAHVQRQAVARIQRVGGTVVFDYHFSLVTSSWAPNWLRQLEAALISYDQPTDAAPVGTTVPIRTFRFPGADPSALPVPKISFLRGSELPNIDKIGSMTIDGIESARFTAKRAIREGDLKPDDPRLPWSRLNRRDAFESPWQPEWLQRLIGAEYFQDVTNVDLRGDQVTDDGLASIADLVYVRKLFLSHAPKCTDAGLVHLRGLKSLESVSLIETGMTDAGLVHLASVPHLRELFIGSKNITGAGLAFLAPLTELRNLYILDCGLNDAGMAQLAGLTGLEELHLGVNTITNAGLAHLAALTRLEKLDLTFKTWITDAGLEHLKGLVQLRELDLFRDNHLGDAGLVWLGGLKNLCKLNLASTLVTDTGLVHLARLPALQELNLSGNEITDAGLVHLRGMHQLRHLNLDRTNVSDEGVAAIQRALPTLAVSPRKASPGRKGQGLARSLLSPRLQ
jgi:internalin A